MLDVGVIIIRMHSEFFSQKGEWGLVVYNSAAMYG